LNDRHGTRCAGLIAGAANNGICGVGVAYDAHISAIRILSKNLSAKSEAKAVTHMYHDNHIYSCSWGPADDGKAIDGPPKAVLEAFIDGVTNGRSWKGSIYVFASGNGKSVDNCNFDGYANGVFSLTIGAIDNNNAMPVYMEPCAAQIAVTYSSGYDAKIATTDLGNDSCTTKHGGTSAAGIFALVLQTRPDLTWRDLQYLVIETAQPIATLDPSWHRNSAGRAFSQKFGFGKIDASLLVEAAKKWRLVRPPVLAPLPRRDLLEPIPVNSMLGLADTILLDAKRMQYGALPCVGRIEWITVTVDIEHPRRGDLQVFLRSPSGMVSQLATRRPLDDSKDGLRGWTFMTVAFWGEQPEGPWTLNIVDRRQRGTPGILNSWRMTVWGESKEACSFARNLYAVTFLNNFYPASPDYFADHKGLWLQDPELNDCKAAGIPAVLLFAVLLAVAVLFYFVLFVKRLVWRCRYGPVASNNTSHM
jgi:kexin